MTEREKLDLQKKQLELESELIDLEDEEARAQQQPARPPAQATSRTPGKAESGLLGFGQGGTFGFGDEIGAGLQAGLQKLSNVAPKGALEWAGIESRYGPSDAGATYRQSRGENRDLLAKAEDANPYSYNIGSVLGGAAVPLPGGGALGAGKAALGAGGKLIGKAALSAAEKEALKLAMKEAAKRGAIAGAGGGAAFGAGSSKADFTRGEVGRLALDTLLGTGIGAGLGAGLGAGSQWASERVVAPAIKSVADYAKKQGARRSSGALQDKLEQHAQDRAIKAMAGSGHKSTLKSLEHKGIAKQVAKDSIDQGVLRNASADDMAATASERVQHFGNKLGKMIAEGDAKARPMVSGADLAQRVEQEVVAPLLKGNAGDQAVAKRLMQEVETLRGKGDMSFADALTFKNTFNKYLDHGAEQKPMQESLKRVQGLVTRDIDDKLDAIGKSLKSNLGTRFRKTKKLYGSMREAEDMTKERALQLRNNQSISLGDWLPSVGVGGASGLGAGMNAGGVEGALAFALGAGGTALASKLARERGPQLYALGLRRLADSKVADSRTAWKLLSKTLNKANTSGPVLPSLAPRSARLLPQEISEAARPLYAETEEDRLKELREILAAGR